MGMGKAGFNWTRFGFTAFLPVITSSYCVQHSNPMLDTLPSWPVKYWQYLDIVIGSKLALCLVRCRCSSASLNWRMLPPVTSTFFLPRPDTPDVCFLKRPKTSRYSCKLFFWRWFIHALMVTFFPLVVSSSSSSTRSSPHALRMLRKSSEHWLQWSLKWVPLRLASLNWAPQTQQLHMSASQGAGPQWLFATAKASTPSFGSAAPAASPMIGYGSAVSAAKKKMLF